MNGRIITNQYGLKLHVGGRKRPVQTRESHPHLFKSLRAYQKGALPTPPDSFDWTVNSLVAQAMILGNGPDPTAPPPIAATGVGNCTAAGAGHIIDAATAIGGAPAVITCAQAIDFYSMTTGYVLGDESTDQGGDEVTVCTGWQQKGYDGKGTHAIAGWAALTDEELVDATYVKTIAWLFFLYFGVELADAWTQISGDGYTWDVGNPPDPSDGHCVVGLGADGKGVKINSWGFLGSMTYAAIAQFCASAAGGNLFAILTPEVVDRAKNLAPNGFDYDALLADLSGMGGNAPAPPPPPPPPPPPTPGGPVTLAMAQAAVAQSINAGDPLQTRQDAINAANAGLAALAGTGWTNS